MPGKSEKKKKTLNRNNARRATVGDLLKSQQEKKKAKATDLESRFRNRLQSICKCTSINQGLGSRLNSHLVTVAV